MKKIILLKQSSQKQGGLEKYTSKVVEALQGKGCSISLLSSRSIPQLPPSIQQVTPPKTFLNPLFSFQAIRRFDRFCLDYLKSSDYDAVIGMERNSFQTHLRAGNGVHAAYLQLRKRREGFFKQASFLINPLHRLLLDLEKKAFEHQDLKALIVNSNFARSQVLEHYNTDPKKIHVIHNGVEWDEWEPYFSPWEEKKKEVLHSFNLPKETYHFLFMGHDFKRKGLKEVLEALAVLEKPFHLSIVGEDKNKDLYQNLAYEWGLSSKVSFFGKTSLAPLFYQYADCLVIPSIYDPFANVTVEALAMGLYVISSPFNGGSEVINKECGVVLPSLKKEALVDALRQAMDRPKTKQSAQKIRSSVKELDFPYQLSKFCEICLS